MKQDKKTISPITKGKRLKTVFIIQLIRTGEILGACESYPLAYEWICNHYDTSITLHEARALQKESEKYEGKGSWSCKLENDDIEDTIEIRRMEMHEK